MDDEFMEIVNNNELEDFMSQSESHTMTIKDLHLGLRDLAEAMLYITDFVNSVFIAVSESEDTPALTVASVVYAQEMFKNAANFCESVVEGIDEDEDEEDDDDSE